MKRNRTGDLSPIAPAKIPNGYKRCKSCNFIKLLEEFPFVKGKPFSYCKVCWQSKTNLRRKGIREELITIHGGICSCCGESKKEFLRFNKKFQKLLCFNCYQGLVIYKLCPHQWLYLDEVQLENSLKNLTKMK